MRDMPTSWNALTISSIGLPTSGSVLTSSTIASRTAAAPGTMSPRMVSPFESFSPVLKRIGKPSPLRYESMRSLTPTSTSGASAAATSSGVLNRLISRGFFFLPSFAFFAASFVEMSWKMGDLPSAIAWRPISIAFCTFIAVMSELNRSRARPKYCFATCAGLSLVKPGRLSAASWICLMTSTYWL